MLHKAIEKALLFSRNKRIVELRLPQNTHPLWNRTGDRQVAGCVASNWRLFMNLTISGHHLEVTPALRSYVTEKLDRIMRHFDQVVDVKVLLTVEKQKEKERRQRAECNIHVKGNDMFAQSSHQDLYAAVDDLVDKLDRQVGRHKQRIQDHHHAAPKRLM
jgi:putative sigma-54 modulation protein